jgi:hypothetical protein
VMQPQKALLTLVQGELGNHTPLRPLTCDEINIILVEISLLCAYCGSVRS